MAESHPGQVRPGLSRFLRWEERELGMGPRWREAEMGGGGGESGRPETGTEPCRTGGSGGVSRAPPSLFTYSFKTAL